MSAWSQTTNNVVLQFDEDTPSKTTNPETGIYVQGKPYTEDNNSAWKVDGDNALELSVPQGYVITKVEFGNSPFIEGDCIDQCDCLIPGTENETWVQEDGKLDYFSTIKFNAKSPAYIRDVFVYYHRCSGATYHEAVNATCTTKGKAEYWKCTCGKIYSDADCTNMVTDMTSLDTEIDPTNHADLEEHARVEATCTKDGNIHYWHCNGCGKDFEDEDAEKEIADVTISKELASHNNLVYVEAKAATDTEIGYTVNHWHCQDCGKNFEDQECTKPITDDVIIPITGTLNYLCFTANAVGSTVELIKNGNPYDVILQYSTDFCNTWQTVNFSTATTTGTITLEKVNDKVYFRNTRPASEVSGFSKDYSGGDNDYRFKMSGSIAASGNVMSLVDSKVESEKIPADYCFANLFQECRALTSAPELPATILADNCYYYMFNACKNLMSAPELPATTLAKGCYYSMFASCSSLTNAPKLPAMVLKDKCYRYMFIWCTSLTKAPELPATTLAEYCYFEMFYSCKNLTSAPELKAESLKDYCYYGMFEGCTSLETAPTLPATTLAEACYKGMFQDCTNLKSAPELKVESLEDYCYSLMFYGCTSLKSAPVLPATTMKPGCYYEMFGGCTNLTNAPELPAMTLAESCYEFMFYDCESLTEAPDLPATTLCTGCYNSMFEYCTNLKSIKVGFTDWYYDAATYYWFYGSAEGGIFICPDELPMNDNYYCGIPYNWTRAYEVKANKDPESVNYYSTFYSGTNAYEVPSGVTAYTGVAEGNVLKLTAIESGVIPAKEPVILKATQSQVYLPYTTTTATKSTDNKLSGTDEATTLGANQYALSLGQNGVGFYLWEGKSIGAHKAYLTLPASSAKAFTFQFDDGETTGILKPVMDEKKDSPAYNLNGVRVNDNYKGIVIKNGKKIYQK